MVSCNKDSTIFDPPHPSLLSSKDLHYLGSFRLDYVTGQEARLGFSEGRFAVSPETNSFFIEGKPSNSIAEFAIPELTNTTVLSEMKKTGPTLQEFSLFNDRVPFKTPNNDIRNIGGMELIDGKLIVTVFDPYDAASATGFDVDNLMIIEDPSDLANSDVRGYIGMNDKMRATGWMSPIPLELQGDLGGNYLTGGARMASINARWSMGPSAYSFNKEDLLTIGSGGTVPNTRLQEYPLHNRLAENSFNYPRPYTEECPDFVHDASKWRGECVGDNDLWTELSRGIYGVIVPGTRTYLTIGSTGGIRHGIAYKNTPIGRDGACSGECPHDWDDWDNYIWLYDVQDLIDHKNGLTKEYEARPYEYGPIVVPVQDPDNDGHIATIIGADYDEINNRLYISLKADTEGGYETIPLIAVYEIAL
ncbi:hypothetical protein GCM10011506_04930 [Marivirga lumbricoides]|uniref:DUF4185 domain-containing protein n=2 Tax=Marivirga lumbricoides TaxID=1046115 RepID=A0ABQ1LFU7_9BACT|nr:hypothetical protein GCM10011506_04930 [Marivirga lumbricoides]